jgi:hypothetical protein
VLGEQRNELHQGQAIKVLEVEVSSKTPLGGGQKKKKKNIKDKPEK